MRLSCGCRAKTSTRPPHDDPKGLHRTWPTPPSFHKVSRFPNRRSTFSFRVSNCFLGVPHSRFCVHRSLPQVSPSRFTPHTSRLRVATSRLAWDSFCFPCPGSRKETRKSSSGTRVRAHKPSLVPWPPVVITTTNVMPNWNVRVRVARRGTQNSTFVDAAFNAQTGKWNANVTLPDGSAVLVVRATAPGYPN